MSDRHHWHRTDDHGIPVQFTAHPNGQGNFVLTPQELEGLMRAGGWKPGPIPERKTLAERLREAYPDGLPAATWETPEDLARMSIETHARQQQEKTP